MSENNSDLKTNQLDCVRTSLVCLVESEAEEMLSNGQNPHAKRILDACDKLFRWGSTTRGHLTAEQRAQSSRTSRSSGVICGVAFRSPLMSRYSLPEEWRAAGLPTVTT